MSQRTSLIFWCFILGLVPLHGHSAHLRPIFGRVQVKIIWFLCMTNLKTSGEHLLLLAAPWSRSLSGSRKLFTSQIPRMKDHAVVTIVAENCHEIAECSCRQTGIQQKLKSLVQQPLPHGSATLAKHADMHRASKRGSYLAGFPLAFLSERNFRIASLGQTQLEVSRCHTYLTSQCLSHATHPWKAVKAGHAQHFPSPSSLGSESQIWHLGNPTQTVGVNWIGEGPQTTAHTDLPITTFAIITWNNPNFQLRDTNASYKAMAANGLSGWPRWPRLSVRLSLPVVLHEAQVEAAGFNCFCLTSADRNKHASCSMQQILLTMSCFWGTHPRCQKWSRHVLAPSQGLCPPSLLQDLTLISLFPKDMCKLKIKHLTFHDKTFQRIAWTCSLLRAVELGICKDSRQGLGLLWSLTRKVEEETHVANTLIITLIIALGKHPDHHTEFACLRQLLLRMRLQEAISEGSVDRRRSSIWHSMTRRFKELLGHVHCWEQWNSAFARTHGKVWGFFDA